MEYEDATGQADEHQQGSGRKPEVSMRRQPTFAQHGH
jgi:hypothetical protein